MSLSENGLSAADVAAVMGSNGNSWGNNWGDGSFWIIILFLFALMGGNGFGGYGNNAVPYMFNQNNDVQRGFDQQAVMSGINGLNSAVSNGFANAEVSRCNAQANTLQAMNSLAMSLQNCCCENRAGLADLKYTVATENCSDRQVVSDGIRDLMASNAANTQALVNSTNAGFQSIMDKICQLELDGKNQQIQNLQTQLNMATLRESQNSQTAQIEQYLNPAPIPAYVVQKPNCCQPTYGCGCNSVVA